MGSPRCPHEEHLRSARRCGRGHIPHSRTNGADAPAELENSRPSHTSTGLPGHARLTRLRPLLFQPPFRAPRQQTDEAHIPAQQSQAQAYPRFPGTHGNPQRPHRPCASPCQGTQASHGLIQQALRGCMGVSRFPRQARLLKPAEFKRVFANPPLRFSAGEILLLATSGESPSPRLGVVAPKKACRLATGRNRFKRQVRESYRLRQDSLGRLDIIILARNGIADLDNAGIRQRLDTLWTRLLKRAPSVLASLSPPESSSP